MARFIRPGIKPDDDMSSLCGWLPSPCRRLYNSRAFPTPVHERHSTIWNQNRSLTTNHLHQRAWPLATNIDHGLDGGPKRNSSIFLIILLMSYCQIILAAVTTPIDNITMKWSIVHQPPLAATLLFKALTRDQVQHDTAISIISMRTIETMAPIWLPSRHTSVLVPLSPFLLLLNPLQNFLQHQIHTLHVFRLLALKLSANSVSLPGVSDQRSEDFVHSNIKLLAKSASLRATPKASSPWFATSILIGPTVPDNHRRVRMQVPIVNPTAIGHLLSKQVKILIH